MAGQMSRRALVGLAAAALLIVPAARAPAPASSDTVRAQQDAPVEITFWSWVPGIEDQVNAFNAAQSAIHVTYVNKGNGNAEYAVFKTALEANSDIPDVVQIEFQHLPSFIARSELADLTQYGANDVKDQFLPWTVAQASQGSGIYAYPQDAGPMILMCNKQLLDDNGIAVPTTWDEFATSAATLHSKNAEAYLANFTSDQGHFFGLLWQSGAKPFAVDGANITINFTSPEVTRVAELWDGLIKSGNLAPADTYSSDWSTAIGNGTIACWASGAWGPGVIEPNAPDLAGKWQAYLMPQWTAGGAVNGNYGGSTIAVTAASAHPQEAETFNRWLNTDPAATLPLANGPAGLFPVTLATIANPEWSEFTSDFWGGQKLHQVTGEAAAQVDVNFQWSPFTDFVYQTYASELVNVMGGTSTLVQAMANLQAQSIQFATDQGFTVVAP
jgi:multiple sugar transport system substrate-binding protein